LALVVRITSIALGWIDATIAFGAVVRKAVWWACSATADDAMTKFSKFDREYALLKYFADASSILLTNAVDPMRKYGRETGTDVVFTYRDKTIGVQVTEYDGGEALPGIGKGTLRGQEAKARRAQTPSGMFVGNQPLASIAARIIEKIQKARDYCFDEVDEVWLLVSSNLPEAIGTFVPKGLVTTQGLSSAVGTALASSKYDRVIYHQVIYPILCEWSADAGWISR
jgi:hypothetical protein